MGGIVLTKIKDSDTNETYAVNLNFLSYIEKDGDIYRVHFLDNTITVKMTYEDLVNWLKANHLPYDLINSLS